VIVETASLDRGAPRKRVLLSDEEARTLCPQPRTFRATLRDTTRDWFLACRRYLVGRQDVKEQASQEVEYR